MCWKRSRRCPKDLDSYHPAGDPNRALSSWLWSAPVLSIATIWEATTDGWSIYLHLTMPFKYIKLILKNPKWMHNVLFSIMNELVNWQRKQLSVSFLKGWLWGAYVYGPFHTYMPVFPSNCKCCLGSPQHKLPLHSSPRALSGTVSFSNWNSFSNYV